MAVVIELVVDVGGDGAVFFAVGAVIAVVVDEETGKVAAVFGAAFVDKRLRADAFFLGAQHDGGAVSIIGADVVAFVAAQTLETYPDIGLDVFDHVAEVNGAVGIRQGAGYENAAFGLRHVCLF